MYHRNSLWEKTVSISKRITTREQHQEELIRKNTNAESRVLLMLDEDDAGKAARDEIAVRLSKLCFVKTFVFHEAGMQPEDLGTDEVQQIQGGLP